LIEGTESSFKRPVRFSPAIRSGETNQSDGGLDGQTGLIVQGAAAFGAVIFLAG